MTAAEIVEKLRSLGTDGYKRVIMNHGALEPVFGVKIDELKKFQKLIKKNYQLALDLFETGIYDAMYLAGLIADDPKMSRADLHHWAESANCPSISEFTVAWVAAESSHGRELALQWIDSPTERLASTGWATWCGLVAITDDARLDCDELRRLLQCVQQTIHQQPNRVRATMNSFVIAVGSYVPALTVEAEEIGRKIGPVTIDVGRSACKVPFAPEYIDKVRQRGSIGKKRKTVKC